MKTKTIGLILLTASIVFAFLLFISTRQSEGDKVAAQYGYSMEMLMDKYKDLGSALGETDKLTGFMREMRKQAEKQQEQSMYLVAMLITFITGASLTAIGANAEAEQKMLSDILVAVNSSKPQGNE